jgi:hypothetical protein
VVLKETSIFTKRIIDLVSDDEYRELQLELVRNPNCGNIIPGSGGLRKMRWKIPGKGKRGGIRIIYYWFAAESIVLMLFVFKKNERSDLDKEQLKLLKNIVLKELL